AMFAESSEEERSNWFHWQQTFVCGFFPGDTSLSNNDPKTAVPRYDDDKTWVFNTKVGNRTTLLNAGPSTKPDTAYNSNQNDPLRRMFGPSSEHPGGVVIHGMADGSVWDIVVDIDSKIYYGTITRAGGKEPTAVTE